MRHIVKLLTISTFIVIIFLSCKTSEKISYFQDLRFGDCRWEQASPNEVRVRPNDKISIIVNGRDKELDDIFNLPINSRSFGNNGNGAFMGISGYTVDENGEIDFPVLGKVKVEGMKRLEIAEYIKQELTSNNLLRDPIVTVEFLNLSFVIIGEVNRPGRFIIDRDKISIIDAISLAGDLTIHGKRSNVLVIRNVNGEERSYQLDLRSAADLYASPVFYLQQNDIVYVEPTSVKARQSTANGNSWLTPGFWMSLTSFVISLTFMFIK